MNKDKIKQYSAKHKYLNLGLNILDGITALDLKRDSLPR